MHFMSDLFTQKADEDLPMRMLTFNARDKVWTWVGFSSVDVSSAGRLIGPYTAYSLSARQDN